MADTPAKGRRRQAGAKDRREAAAPEQVEEARPTGDRHDPPAPDQGEATTATATFTISSADLNRNVAGVIDHVERTGDRFVVTRYNKAVATIVPNQYLGQTFAHVKLAPEEDRREWKGMLEKSGITTGYTSSMAGAPISGAQINEAIDPLLQHGREVLGGVADPQMTPPIAASPSHRPTQRVDPHEAQRRRDALLAKINTSKRRG